MKKVISIGIMCFNEEFNVPTVHKELARIANLNKKYNYEFIFVDNASTDNTRREIISISKKDTRVSGIFLSRNFGPESSAQAALDSATGDAFILYEGDLQDPPDVIPEFIEKWEEGFKVVVGVRDKIDDSSFMTFVRKLYYKFFRTISNIEIPINAGSFSLLDKKAMEAIKKMPEKYRFFRGLRAWVGFHPAYVKYQRRRRERGRSSYNFLGYFHHAERSFFGFSYLPLDIIVYTGLFLVIISFISIIILLALLLFGNTIKESILILFSIVLFGGIQLLALSIIGKYIQVITEETKARPVYIIEEIINKR